MFGLFKNIGLVRKVTELVVGENSKKRQMGLGFAAILYVSFLLDFIDYNTLMSAIPLLGIYMGVAYSSKLTKLGKSLNDLKAKKAKVRKRW